MVEARNGKQNVAVKVPELFKELAKKGKAGRKELGARIEKMVGEAKVDDKLSGLRAKIELLQKTGRERTEMWRGKADSFRADALERMIDIQGKVVSFLGVATREEVAELHRELERLAKRVESGQKARASRKGTSQGEGKA
jgi:polyhydroxyalkanoate synthesis regulator phasin